MCICNDPVTVKTAKTPTSPWRRLLKEQRKPKLSRKVVSGARVNLNRYWSKFEDLAASKKPLTTTQECFYIRRHLYTDDNEVNDNLVNELNEKRK